MDVRRRRLVALVSAALLGLVALTAPGAAEAKGKKHKKHGGKPAASGAGNAAAGAKADANRADALADNARGQAAQLNSALRAAEQAVTEAVAQLQKVEKDLIAAQPADSEFGKARDACDLAKREYEEGRKSSISDATLDKLKKKFDEAREVYEPLRKKLLEGDSDWTTAKDDLKEKRKALADLKRQLDPVAIRAYQAMGNARDADQLANVMQGAGTGGQKSGKSGKGGKGKKHK